MIFRLEKRKEDHYFNVGSTLIQFIVITYVYEYKM